MSRFIRLMLEAWSPTRRASRECCLRTGMALSRTAPPVPCLSALLPGSIRKLQSSWRSSRREVAEEQAVVELVAAVELAAVDLVAAQERAARVAKAAGPPAPEVKVAAAPPPTTP